MKVIHTYATGNTGGPIMKVNFYLAILSAYYAKKNYGNINLYGDRALIKPLHDLGLEYLYDNIEEKEFHSSYLGAWSMPKVYTFADMNEPFMHIDVDTIFFDKIDFENLDKHTANLFCYKDQAKLEFSDYNDGEILKKFMTQEWGYDAQYRTYLNYYFKFWNQFDDEFKKTFNLNSIPNMNIVYAQDYGLIKEASELVIKFFDKNKEVLEKDRNAACFLEQFLINHYMRMLDSDYLKASDAGNHVLFETEPWQPWEINFDPYLDQKYPFAYSYDSICNSCTTGHKTKVSIDRESEIDKLYNDDMGGFFHVTYNKEAPIIESYILHQLERIIGLEKIQEIWKYYEPFMVKIQQDPLTRGEKLFEKHKQQKIFK